MPVYHAVESGEANKRSSWAHWETYNTGRTRNASSRRGSVWGGANAGGRQYSTDGTLEGIERNRGPSSPELHLAGSVSRNGGVEVHGASSMLHNDPTYRLNLHRSPFTSASEKEDYNKNSQARLVAFSSQQNQAEAMLRRNPVKLSHVDFDGVNPALALHLIGAHFNRQHFTFMITYRPAIMDSLINGGPYCNKILLNAIYLSSSVYSGRKELRLDPADRESTGERFLRRLRILFSEYIDTPSIPTATGLLLSGAILVSKGQMSAGWVHTGIAYRMIIDLGCHLAVEMKAADTSTKSALQADIDLEIRKRLYWGAFLTDATQSLYFGRPQTLMPAQARVSRKLLDTYEELKMWLPYQDSSGQSWTQNDSSYAPRPAYAISTFNGMVGLFEISSRIVASFYSMQSLNISSSDVRQLKSSIELDLEQWFFELPDILKLDLDSETTFAPHQMTLL